jgi:hypothetical protein
LYPTGILQINFGILNRQIRAVSDVAKDGVLTAVTTGGIVPSAAD